MHGGGAPHYLLSLENVCAVGFDGKALLSGIMWSSGRISVLQVKSGR